MTVHPVPTRVGLFHTVVVVVVVTTVTVLIITTVMTSVDTEDSPVHTVKHQTEPSSDPTCDCCEEQESSGFRVRTRGVGFHHVYSVVKDSRMTLGLTFGKYTHRRILECVLQVQYLPI